MDIDDLLEPKVSNESLPVLLREFERLIFVEFDVAGDPRPLADLHERESCACSLRWSSTSIKTTIAFSAKATDNCAAFSASALASWGDKPSAATPAAAAAITSVCCRRKSGLRYYYKTVVVK